MTPAQLDRLAARLDDALRRGDWQSVDRLIHRLCPNIPRFWYAGQVEAGSKARAYLRVSTSEQGVSGLGLDAQETAIRAYADQRGWVLADVVREVASGSAKKRRPGLDALTAGLGKGEILLVAKGDRLARSLSGYVGIIEAARSGGWTIVAANGTIDLTTPHGRAMASMAAVFAELERDLIGERTREALQIARRNGTRLGRPPVKVDAKVRADVRRWRRAGWTLRRIANRLDERQVPTPTGVVPVPGRTTWHASQVARLASRGAPSRRMAEAGVAVELRSTRPGGDSHEVERSKGIERAR